MLASKRVWLAAAGLAALLLLVALILTRSVENDTHSTGTAAIGGPFRLTTHEGRLITSEDLRGRPFAVFFGFTHCPDVCPTTLHDLSQDLAALGPEADALQVLFISVDPARDTPELLRAYLASFDPRIRGLTGSEDEIAAAAKAYKAFYRRVPTPDGYTMDHTATVYLMDRRDRFFSAISFGEVQEARRAKLRRLLREG